MSASPISIGKRELTTAQRGELEKARKRAARRSDSLYIAGAALVTLGMGLVQVKFAFIVAGAFCLLFPLLELATGFIRGIRRPQR